jgi:pimeloyl-ACP methyl ester carboxylesterase
MSLIGTPSAATSTSKQSSNNPALAVLVFVHGFKGDDKTFGDYPSRLQHSIASTLGPGSDVHAWVYPSFDTRGELGQCVHSFGEWLTTRVAELEMETASKAPDGKKSLARVVLVGHSMGGIVIADFASSIAKRGSKNMDIWPKVVGVLAYDTPCKHSLLHFRMSTY